MANATAWRSFWFVNGPFLKPNRRSSNAVPGLTATTRPGLPFIRGTSSMFNSMAMSTSPFSMAAARTELSGIGMKSTVSMMATFFPASPEDGRESAT